VASVPTRVATGKKALMDIGDGGFKASCASVGTCQQDHSDIVSTRRIRFKNKENQSQRYAESCSQRRKV